MKMIRISLLLTVCLISLCAFSGGAIPFDDDWKFFKGDIPGAEQISFDDSGWRKLNLPHDWSIEGPFDKTNKTGGAGAWLPHGVGWYRKGFALPKERSSKRFRIEFDGVMQNSEVWINGVSLGKRPSGYVSFGCDLTQHLKFGGETNVIAVRADTSAQPASRWYSGAGIYRHVRLNVTDLIHFEPDSVFITTPEIKSDSATVRVEARVVNDSSAAQKVFVASSVSGPPGSAPDGSYGCSGESARLTVEPGMAADVKFEVKVPWPARTWNVEHPDLHRAWVRLRAGEKTLDEAKIRFGVRTAEFTPTNGFVLNGKKVVLNGVCLHHDGGAFGAAVPLGVWERRLTNLRELGVNAIRTAHNPVAPEFLDLCDRMGFLVMDEFFDCWTVKKNPYDYAQFFTEWSKRDAADTVRRDRNHPSVILYCIGNEIHDTPKPGIAIPIASNLVQVCHENDPTRPVTQALFRPNVSHDYDNGLADLLDVVGTNYRDNELLAAQRAKPSRKIIGTEQRHDRQTWLWLRDNPSHSGQFLWTGVDYLGETRSWPRTTHPSGLLDRMGELKPMGFERLSWWSEKPVVRMARRVASDDLMPSDPGYGGEERHTQVQFADWSPRKTDAHEETVEVFSNCEDVELFLNNKSLGAKPINKDATPRVWKVNYEAGSLKAVARNGGKEVAGDALRTAGKAVKIILYTDGKKLGSTWDDVAFVRATVVDGNGVVVPRANDLIRFNIEGPGVIAAVDNADNASLESFQATQRSAYQGVCFAMVKFSGPVGTKKAGPKKIIVTAQAEGLEPGRVEIIPAGE